MKVCLGGTFYPLHKGHQQLLRKAFQVAGPQGFVFIGVTTSAMAKKKGPIASFEKRKAILMQFIQEERVFPKVSIQPLTDKYGPALYDDFDAIVVSPETEKTAEEMNRKRIQHGKQPLQIFVIPFVLSEDGKPISSTRIRHKEIDENGRKIQQD